MRVAAAAMAAMVAAVGAPTRARPRGPPGAGAPRLPSDRCPAPIAREVLSSGLLSVRLLNATADGVTDDAAAVRAAIRLSVGPCGGRVFFPSGTYLINSTIVLCDGELGMGQFVSLVGEGDGKGSSSKLISHNATAPILLLGGHYKYSLGASFHLDHLGIHGAVTGVAIVSSATAFFTNCDISASLNTGTIDNAALVVNNSFWIWFESTDCKCSRSLCVCYRSLTKTAAQSRARRRSAARTAATTRCPPSSYAALPPAPARTTARHAWRRTWTAPTSCASTAPSSPTAGCSTSSSRT